MSLARSISRINIPGLPQVIPVMAVLMEVLWAYAWLIWIGGWETWGWERTPLNIGYCILQAVFTEILARFSLSREWSIKRARWIVISASLILLIILVRLDNGGGYSLWEGGWVNYAGTHLSAIITAFIFGFYIVWRGIAASQPKFTFSDLYRKFVIGIVGVVLVLIMWGFTADRDTIWSSAGVYVIAFFGIGLLTLAIANLQALRAELLQHKEDISAFSRRWLSMLVILILAILGLSVVLASIFSNNIWGSIIGGLNHLVDWLFIALSYILLPLGYLIEAIIFVGKWLINLLSQNPQPLKMDMFDMSNLQKAAEGQPGVSIPTAVILALKWGFLVLIIGLVIFFLSRTLMRYWESKNPKEIEEVHETVWSWGLFRTDLRLLLAWLFRWTKRRKKTVEEGVYQPPLASINSDDDSARDYTVRELYQAMLWEGRQLGTARKQSETPYEYRKKLVERIDKAAPEIDALTDAYIIERYGQINPTHEKVSLLNRIWRKLRAKITNREDTIP
jgi:hypothetical protein